MSEEIDAKIPQLHKPSTEFQEELKKPRKKSLVYNFAHTYFKRAFEKEGFYESDSPEAQGAVKRVSEKVSRHEPVLIVGTNVSCHNTGVALIEIGEGTGQATVVASMEEERFDGIRFSENFPINSLRELEKVLQSKGKTLKDIDAWVNGWNYPKAAARGASEIAIGFPSSCGLLNQENIPEANFGHIKSAIDAPKKISELVGKKVEMVGMDHHKAHAAAYFLSPFYNSESDQNELPVMVLVTDGFGDNSSISRFTARGSALELVDENHSMLNSLGVMYAAVSASLGGFPPLSSEGRIMGAAGFARYRSRDTNSYYKKLVEANMIIYKPDGQIEINRELLNVHKSGMASPYSNKLKEILGEPIPKKDFWNPDLILHAEDYNHLESSQRLSQADRLDKAAALQMVLEDAMAYTVGDMIKKSKGGNKLVLSGGVALNCQASLYLARNFSRDYYLKNFGEDKTLEIWTPPTPSDTGVAMGAALEFARRAGVGKFTPLKDAFIGGLGPTEEEIRNAVNHPGSEDLIKIKDQFHLVEFGNINTNMEGIADQLAYLVESGQIIGLFQGPGEAGPRALGHRTILANPKDPELRNKINERVKKREKIRPVAPIMTLEAAQKYMDLPEAFSPGNFNTLNYMVMAVPANELAKKEIPAVVHNDGTSRVQVVRKETDPFTYAYLQKLGERIGAEVSINTSLNVGGPIVQTPEQALNALRKSGGMGGIMMIADSGEAFMVVLDTEKKSRSGAVENFGQKTLQLLRDYGKEST